LETVLQADEPAKGRITSAGDLTVCADGNTPMLSQGFFSEEGEEIHRVVWGENSAWTLPHSFVECFHGIGGEFRNHRLDSMNPLR